MKKLLFAAIILALLLAPLNLEAKKKVKEPEVPQMMNYPSAEIDKNLLHGGNVVLQGHIVVPEGEKVPQDVLDKINGRFTVIMRDYLVNKEKNSVIEFKPDGTFSMNLHVPYPKFVLLYPLADVYACPGDTVDVTIDTTKPTREEGLIIGGTGVSGEVSKLTYKIGMTFFPPQRSLNIQNPDSLMKWKDEQVEKLDNLVRNMNEGLPELEDCSPLASDILRTYILWRRLYNICNEYYLFVDGNDSIDREAFWQQYFSFVTPREKYLLDNPLLMIAGDDMFFNRMEFTLMRPFDPYFMSTHDIWEKNKELLQDKLHLSPTNFSWQVCRLHDIFTVLKWYKTDFDAAAEDFAQALPGITNPELIRLAVLTYRDYVKENEIKVVEDKPMTKGDSIFQRIIEPYKGNVLYVDFWEMSCGPCRATMLHMRDQVEAHKDKPIKYLYITDDTPEQCKSFLEPNNIKGEHIHITRSEWGYLQEKFQFTGIPFIVLFDKQGKQRKDVTVDQLLNE